MSQTIARACKRVSRRVQRHLVSAAAGTAAASAPSTHASRCARAARHHIYVKACRSAPHVARARIKTRRPVARKAPTRTHPRATHSASCRAGSWARPPPAPAPAPASVASTAPCANTDLTPDPTNIAVVETATLCLVNQVRGQHGLPALAPDADAAAVGRPAQQRHGRAGLLRPQRPGRRHAAQPHRGHRLPVQPQRQLCHRREHRLGHAQPLPAERDGQRLGQLPRPPGQHPQPELHRQRPVGLAAGPAVARRGAAGRDLHAGLRRDRHGGT